MFIIQTHDLHFSYGRQAVLKGINLQVPAASIFGFLGVNGAGKSTTLKILLGLLGAPRNRVFLFGQDMVWHRLSILGRTGALIDGPTFYEHLSARSNLTVIARLLALPSARVARVLELVDLAHVADKPAVTYSTGMKQRLGIAIALLNDPPLLILDEPANGLDPLGILGLRNFLVRLQKEEGKTILLSSHLLDELQKIVTHVAILHEGLIRFQGRVEELTGGAGTLEGAFLKRIETL
jgi:ABC-2 type transport system ATP-binding protein